MEYTVYNSPIGRLKIEREDGFITRVVYAGKSLPEENTDNPILLLAKEQLEEYFEGRRKDFSLPIRIDASPYRKKVLRRLMDVEYGQTVTYGELARKTGNPKAARSVGTAMRYNPLVIIIPCHRVLPKNGKIGNYSAGGSENKRFLLDLERKNRNGL